MSNNISMNEFYSSFNEEISMAKDSETYGWEGQDFFTAVMLEYLEDAAEIEDPVICPFRGYGLQLNAYSISEEYDNIDIFVSIYHESNSIQSISRTEVDAAIKRAIQLYRKATNDLYVSFEKDSDTYEFAISLHNHREDIKKVRIVALTNSTVKAIAFNNLDLNGVEVSFSIWDMDRLYRCTTSGKMRETIEIDFESDYGTTIPCIENKTSDKYSVYLAIINGDLLAQIYEEHGPRLFERNVRSFLQVKGAVNKGIRDTLHDEPDMFLAYNNGISVTAESIDIVRDDNGKPSIRKIRDMQIVNGGQTTASIYNARKDKKINADLTKVFVQMKLSVIDTSEDMDEIVPKISAFANTQNKIQMADFSANDLFHRKIEELSRITWAPAQGGMKSQNWFYERARGQYSDMLSKESTTLRRKAFKETHPLFTKTDLAKYENTWDQLPYQVSEGAQKNFKKYTVRLSERGSFIPDGKYYERLVAKAILFRRTEKLIQQQQYGGYRANIVTYTLAYLSYATAQRIDLDRIWKEQSLTPALEENIIKVSKIVHNLIVNPPKGANVGEWCKKQQCWNAIKAYDYTITDALNDELIDVSHSELVISSSSAASTSSFNVVSAEENELISRAADVPASTWYALSKWAKETNNFQGWQRSIIFSVGQLVARGKKPSYKQSVQALKVYDEAVIKGFKTE
ncbi:AIPR family protein [Sedimentibacter sp. B4]|uniref:AIPR family protein n=1 Tax=Sedimentibacter sp. B4 TaxID=304766 RepID=UPI0002DC898D|nr:AIPR family protein [Sedimentibacter sp. B4]